jgi:type IV pilus assembly protein PilW
MKGLSLIELMIAMTLGLVIMLGAIGIFLSTARGFQLQEGYARLQENARVAVQMIGHEVRMAGFNGCPRSNRFNNNLNNAGTLWWSPLGSQNNAIPYAAIVGIEDNEVHPSIPSGGAPGNRVQGTDALLLMRSGQQQWRVESHAPASARIAFAGGPAQAQAGSLWLVCNMEITTLFQMTGPNNGIVNHIVHNTGSSQTPGNCTKDLDRSCPITPPAPPASNYDLDDAPPTYLMSFEPTLYYIGVSRSCAGQAGCNRRSLFRALLQASAGAGTFLQEEILEGIYDMELSYALTQIPGIIGPAVAWQEAADIDAADWPQVNAVSFRLLAATSIRNSASDTQSFNFNGQNLTLPDRMIGQEVAFVVGLRNYLK